MKPELKIVKENGVKRAINKYPLSVEQIVRLCRDFQADCYDGFVSNDEAYIMSKLKDLK